VRALREFPAHTIISCACTSCDRFRYRDKAFEVFIIESETWKQRRGKEREKEEEREKEKRMEEKKEKCNA